MVVFQLKVFFNENIFLKSIFHENIISKSVLRKIKYQANDFSYF